MHNAKVCAAIFCLCEPHRTLHAVVLNLVRSYHSSILVTVQHGLNIEVIAKANFVELERVTSVCYSS